MTNYFKHKMRGKSPAVIAGMVVLGIIAFIGLLILMGFVIMWLWNWLMPELFGLPTVTYWQAVGLCALSKILFGGFGGGGGGSSRKSNSDSCEKEKGKKKRTDFSKWEHYDKFWKEKGDQAYMEYLEEMNNPGKTEPSSESDPEEPKDDKAE